MCSYTVMQNHLSDRVVGQNVSLEAIGSLLYRLLCPHMQTIASTHACVQTHKQCASVTTFVNGLERCKDIFGTCSKDGENHQLELNKLKHADKKNMFTTGHDITKLVCYQKKGMTVEI